MSEIVRLRTRAEIDEEAAAWTWRLDSADVSAIDQRAFDAWVRQDPRHRRAMDEMSKAWKSLDGLAEATRLHRRRRASTDTRPAFLVVCSRCDDRAGYCGRRLAATGQ
jgi:ferric-dicitrate binding protein FerR (iron transport regulator)